MIPVQIASRLSPLGVEGVRWVLVDPSDAAGPAAPTPAAVLAAYASPDDPADEGSLLTLALLKLLLTGLGLGAALWAAQGWLGAPTAAGLVPLVGPSLKPTPPAATLPSTLVPRPESAPAEALPMLKPLLTLSPDAAPDAVPGAPSWAAPPAPPTTVAPEPWVGPPVTVVLR